MSDRSALIECRDALNGLLADLMKQRTDLYLNDPEYHAKYDVLKAVGAEVRTIRNAADAALALADAAIAAEAALADAFVAGWKKHAGRTHEVSEKDALEAASKYISSRELIARTGGEQQAEPVAWLSAATMDWLENYDGPACARMTAVHNRPIMGEGGTPVFLHPKR